jgi:hypothetical protein
LVGAEYLNTITGHPTCTIVFAMVTAIISFFVSLPRTFSGLARLATLSAFFTFVSVLLATIFAAIEPHPAGYNPDPNHVTAGGTAMGGEPKVLAFPPSGTTYVAAMGAFLNISYTFIGQITLPSFIAEMKEPQEFWKSVTAVTIAEVIVFSIVGAVIYAYTGTQYMTAPAFGSLGDETYKKVAFSFMIPTLIFLGVLYASVSARFIFFRLFDGTRHKSSHTVVGWASWAGILAILWVLAFIVAEVIPFFSDLLAIMSSLFDSFFGFIFWGMAYIRMRQADYGPDFYKTRGIRGWLGFLVNVSLILIGIYFLGPGTYVRFSVDFWVETVTNPYLRPRSWVSFRAMKRARLESHSLAPTTHFRQSWNLPQRVPPLQLVCTCGQLVISRDFSSGLLRSLIFDHFEPDLPYFFLPPEGMVCFFSCILQVERVNSTPEIITQSRFGFLSK